MQDIEITGYNSPYPIHQDSQSVDDIRYAILQQRIINLEKLKDETEYELKIKCKFVENMDSSFNQIFNLQELREKT